MRKIIQISTTGVENTSCTQCNHITTVLCDDGSVWEIRDNQTTPQWQQLPPIPQEVNPSIPKLLDDARLLLSTCHTDLADDVWERDSNEWYRQYEEIRKTL